MQEAPTGDGGGASSSGSWVPLLLALGVLAVVVLAVVFSKRKTRSWSPEAHGTVLPQSLVGKAFSWYSSAKQEQEDMPLSSYAKTCYGLENLRAVQTAMSLDAVRDAHLPEDIDGPSGLLLRLTDLQAKLQKRLQQQVPERTPITGNSNKAPKPHGLPEHSEDPLFRRI